MPKHSISDEMLHIPGITQVKSLKDKVQESCIKVEEVADVHKIPSGEKLIQMYQFGLASFS